MKRENKIFYVGSLKITRIDEMTLRGAHPAVLLGENWQPAALEKHREWLIPENLDADDQTLVQSTHCWLVQSPEFTLLVDTASGNDKERPDKPVFHHLQTDFLAKLAAAGVSPQEVDYVLLTHLHVDHVGWNTRLVDGQWVPTFPKATYLMSATEAEHFTSPARDNDAAIPGIDIFNDSVLPVIKAGQARFVPRGGGEVLDGVHFIPTPGHSLDHMSISIQSQGEEAFFAGDILHHPLQVYYPELNSMYCEFAGSARASRLWSLQYAVERQAVWFSTHFAASSAGRITRDADAFHWQFL
ncbi:MBL fold metallo-hydrolase [Ewingella americana]